MRLLSYVPGVAVPFIPVIPPRHHKIRLESEKLTEAFLAAQDCVVVVTDHSAYNHEWIVHHAPLVVDTRTATAGVALGSGQIVKA